MAEVASTVDKSKVLNFNVGVLGHIDSGKTSLGKSVISPRTFCHAWPPYTYVAVLADTTVSLSWVCS